MIPINLYNYHLLGVRKPHSRETQNKAPIKRGAKKKPIDFMKGR